MNATLTRPSRAAVSDAYTDLQPLVAKIANRFSKLYGRDPEDTLAEANFLFVVAYNSFDLERGTCIQQRLQTVIWCRLLDTVRKETRQAGLLKRVDAEFDAMGSETPESFDREELDSWLTEDARTVASLLFDTPRELLALIRSDKRKPGRGQIRKHLYRYLRNVLSWSKDKICDAFHELSEVVKS